MKFLGHILVCLVLSCAMGLNAQDLTIWQLEERAGHGSHHGIKEVKWESGDYYYYFGHSPRSSSAEIILHILNEGATAQTISELEFIASGHSYSLIEGPASFPVTLFPGDDIELVLKYDVTPGYDNSSAFLTVKLADGSELETIEFESGTPATPPNNDCSDAIEIACGGAAAIDGTTVGASTEGPITFCGTASTSPGVWYTFTAAATESITFDVCGAPFDSKISIYSAVDCADLGAATCEIGEDDDFIICGGNDPSVDLAAVAGTTYYILVHGFGGGNGPFTLNHTAITCPVEETVPTMGEWGLIVLGLLFLSFGLMFVYERKEKLSRA